MCSINQLECSVYHSITQLYFYLMLEVYLHLQPKVQLHVSALDNSHLQFVYESLESSYIQDLIWAVYIIIVLSKFYLFTN